MLADALLLVHSLFIVFVVGGQVCILLGGWRRWCWVRGLRFRVIHLIAIGFVVAQSWLGILCPLTVWENTLRTAAGETTYPGTFVGYGLSRLVYYDAPQWVFVVCYTFFGVLVLASWIIVKPIRRKVLSEPDRHNP